MGLITYNGQLLLAPGGLANTIDCCCGGRNCYCFTHSVNLVVVARWRRCYRYAVYVPALAAFVFPDGQPCDGTANGMICPPGAFGRSVTFTGNAVNVCSCGDSSSSYNASLVLNQTQFDNCTPLGSPP
jgi:hypothetical protein